MNKQREQGILLCVMVLLCFMTVMVSGSLLPSTGGDPLKSTEGGSYFVNNGRIYISKFPINVNHTSVAELDTVPGLGPYSAEKIYEYIQTKGPITRIEQLSEVGGLRMETIKKYLVCS